MLVCAECGQPASFQCTRCESVHYCSAECQRKNWAWHRPQCTAGPRTSRTPLTSRLPSGAAVSQLFPQLTHPLERGAITARYAARPSRTTPLVSPKMTGPRGPKPNRSDPYNQSSVGNQVGCGHFVDPYRSPKMSELQGELDASMTDWKNSNDASTVPARDRVQAARSAIKVRQNQRVLEPRPPFSPCNPSEARSTITFQRRGHENHSHMNYTNDPWRFEQFWAQTPSDGPYNASSNNAYVNASSPAWLKRRYQTAERLMKKDKRAVIDPSARCNYNPSSHSDAKKTTQIAYFLNSPDAEQQMNDRLETQERTLSNTQEFFDSMQFKAPPHSPAASRVHHHSYS